MKLDKIHLDRFFNKIKFTDTCWNWNGAKSTFGYGRFKVNGIKYSPHRLSYEYFIGLIPVGLLVCHHCDNPSCINPGHLFTGTHQDNKIDCISKHRWQMSDEGKNKARHLAKLRTGEKNYSAKLNWKAVNEVREKLALGFGVRELGRLYGVRHPQIMKIRDNLNWKI